MISRRVVETLVFLWSTNVHFYLIIEIFSRKGTSARINPSNNLTNSLPLKVGKLKKTGYRPNNQPFFSRKYCWYEAPRMQLCQWQNKGLYGSGSRSNRHPGDDCILGATTKGYDSFTRENGGKTLWMGGP